MADQRLKKARSLLARGKQEAAIRLLKGLVREQPQSYGGWLLLSRALYEAGDSAEALQVGTQAERFDPYQEAFGAIQRHMQAQAFAQAAQVAEQMLSAQPGHPRAIFTLAHLAMARGDTDEAIQLLEEGLRVSPANLMLRQMLTDAQMAAGVFAGAIATARSRVAIQESFDTLWALVTVLLRLAQHDELLALLEQAQTHVQGDAGKASQIEMVRGQVLRILGQREQSVAALRASIAINPGNGAAWWSLADMKNHLFTNEEQAVLQKLITTTSASRDTRAAATFAHARAVENEQGITAAMPLYAEANALKDTAQFSPSGISRDLASIRATYAEQALAIQAAPSARSFSPIFIVGLPRSGSTLVEQILASHSQIQGTIEQPTMGCVERRARTLCRRRYGVALEQGINRLSTDELGALGQAYITEGALFRQTDAPWFTDKLPFNFRQVGLIHKILPGAVIIDVRRNPMDCGLSLYKQFFSAGVEWSYNLGHIAAFYNEYVALMDYWDAVLPGRVLRVSYESLVSAPEAEIPRLLAHVGVPFEDSCLSPHETRRSVHTASSEQVRQPISAEGLGLSVQVETALAPLRQGLSPQSLGIDH